MGPCSRRSTWNIIKSIQEGPVIVLTTHFMDEADILGDRIAGRGRTAVLRLFPLPEEPFRSGLSDYLRKEERRASG